MLSFWKNTIIHFEYTLSATFYENASFHCVFRSTFGIVWFFLLYYLFFLHLFISEICDTNKLSAWFCIKLYFDLSISFSTSPFHSSNSRVLHVNMIFQNASVVIYTHTHTCSEHTLMINAFHVEWKIRWTTAPDSHTVSHSERMLKHRSKATKNDTIPKIPY